MKKLALLGFMLGMFSVMGVAVAADDDVTGTWKVKTKRGEKEIESTWKLELKGDKVTGTVSGFGKAATDSKIEDGKFSKGELTFTVVREVKDMKITTKYTGKVTGDAIKGSSTTDFNGKEFKSDFEGKREKK
jgi:hypothetical protein